MANRIRSISHQNQQQQQQRMLINAHGLKPAIKLMDLINESVNNSLIVEENTHPSYTGTTEVNPYVRANNKLSFGAYTDVL